MKKWVFVLLLAAGSSMAMAQQFTNTVEKPLTESITVRQEAQKALDGWGTERQGMESQYESLEQGIERQAAELEAVQKEVAALDIDVREKERRLAEAQRMAHGIEPFLEAGYDRVALLIEQSDPFLAAERKVRLARLRNTLDNPSVTAGEKYRKTLEALFVEAEYGNTVEVYRAEAALDGESIQVDVLRLGRLAMFCQSLDQSRYGVWDPVSVNWQWLPARVAPELSRAFSMAAKRMPLDIVDLPLGKVATP